MLHKQDDKAEHSRPWALHRLGHQEHHITSEFVAHLPPNCSLLIPCRVWVCVIHTYKQTRESRNAVNSLSCLTVQMQYISRHQIFLLAASLGRPGSPTESLSYQSSLMDVSDIPEHVMREVLLDHFIIFFYSCIFHDWAL